MATHFQIEKIETGCKKCGELTDFDFTFAYQPIIDISQKDIFGYEALVRDPETKTAHEVLKKVSDKNRYAFDQSCRTKAIAMAKQLGLQGVLSINFLPNAVYEPSHCIQSTIRAAESAGFPLEKIMFEVTEAEEVYDVQHLRKIFDYYQRKGFVTALDDFGAGHAGLNMLAQFIPNIIKLDMDMVRNIHQDKVKQVIMNSVLDMARSLKIEVLVEGVEEFEEAVYFAQRGVSLMQGYLFAKPGYESLPEVDEVLVEKLQQFLVT